MILSGSQARRTTVALSIAGTDVTTHLTPDLISFEHSDDVERNADTITIKLSDSKHKYLLEWTIDKGTEIVAKIRMLNWDGQAGGLEINCGSFYVDCIEYSPNPSVVVIKATSIPISGSFKGVAKSNGWENQTLKQIAERIAKESGMKLDYRAEDNPKISRCDQDFESDGRLLMRLVSDAGLCAKVQEKTIIIFDEAELDKQEPWTTLTRDVSPIKSWRLRTSSNRTVRGVKASYMDPESGKVLLGEFIPSDPPEGRDCIDSDHARPFHERQISVEYGSNGINAKGSSPEERPGVLDVLSSNPRDKAAATKRAEKQCRKRNRAEWEIDLTLPGSVEWVAGTVVRFDNSWGPKFGDANFLIRRATHKIDRSSGYVCNLSLRKVLKDY